jgi:DNA modification methylase
VPENLLYYGDNLDVLRRHFEDESVDLVYLDPPFKSNQNYNVLFAEQSGDRAAAQIKVFEDTWRWDQAAASAYQEIVERGGPVSQVMQAFRTFVPESDMLAYLAMMAPRLVELRRVLKPTGSIYLHCDPTASHYLKMLMDAVFGPTHFRNEIIWKRTTAHSSSKRYAPIHDTLLYYGKTDSVFWADIRTEYEQAYLDKYYHFDDGDGRLYWRADLCAAGVRHGSSGQPWRGIDPSAKGMHWKFGIETLEKLDIAGRIYWPKKGTMPQYKRYRDELKGKMIPDIWDDVDRINPVGNERLGYPTQKPEALLERIIAESSREGDVVLDPFCGCGTAIAVSQRLNRHWIGIDVTHLAVTLIKHRLLTAFSGKAEYQVIGEPVSVPDAQQLANEDPYQFQVWALGLAGARPDEGIKKGADKGIDGRLFFHDEATGGKTKQIIFSVKAGNIQPAFVQQLRGVIEKEKAEIGVLITMNQPSKNMRAEAASAGFYTSAWGKHPRLQILTVGELMSGKRIDYPPSAQVNKTFKKAPIKVKEATKLYLPLDTAPVPAPTLPPDEDDDPDEPK